MKFLKFLQQRKQQHPRKSSLTSDTKLMNACKLRFLPTPLRGNTSCSCNFIMTLTIFSALLRVCYWNHVWDSALILKENISTPLHPEKSLKVWNDCSLQAKKLEIIQEIQSGFCFVLKNSSQSLSWLSERQELDNALIPHSWLFLRIFPEQM